MKLSDLLWADPDPDYGQPQACHTETFRHNTSRGCSYFFSFTFPSPPSFHSPSMDKGAGRCGRYTAVLDFLKRNKLLAVIRAHEAVEIGCQMFKSGGDRPTLLTLFSAPNYGGIGNKGRVHFFLVWTGPGDDDLTLGAAAVLKYDGDSMNVRHFTAAISDIRFRYPIHTFNLFPRHLNRVGNRQRSQGGRGELGDEEERAVGGQRFPPDRAPDPRPREHRPPPHSLREQKPALLQSLRAHRPGSSLLLELGKRGMVRGS